MKKKLHLFLSAVLISVTGIFHGCESNKSLEKTAEDILGNPEYLAFSYGGYRHNTRDIVPTVKELKEDMKILSVMGVKVLRTYNTQQYTHAANLLEAIKQLKDADPDFEMYVMLGAWIDCEGAWTDNVNHNAEDLVNNTAEIEAAVKLVNEYPDIVKIIAVGNEAMVQWAVSYFVYPDVILKWVEYLKELRDRGEIPAGVWITSSDNYESWGGGAVSYHTEDLTDLIKAVDYISVHTYPFHDSHYNPAFWVVPEEEEDLYELEQIDAAMLRAKNYAISQYQSVADYAESLGITKTIHIGETGWATIASSSYGATGSKAADEYKSKLYYDHMREWTNSEGISCFYFEAFDEQWKDQGNPLGSENHFGLINLKGEAKYALWDMVDEGVFEGLTRQGVSITKSYKGNREQLMDDVLPPPLANEVGLLEITKVNENRETGESVTEDILVIVHEILSPAGTDNVSYPSSRLKLNAWEGTCGIEMSKNGIIQVTTGTGNWWGCALEMAEGKGEDLSQFKSGRLHFDIRGTTSSSFQLGFQTGYFSRGTQVNNYVTFGSDKSRKITDQWQSFSISLPEINQGANLKDVTSLIFLRGENNFDGKPVYLKNIFYSVK